MDDCDWLLSVEKACDWLRIEPGVTVNFLLGLPVLRHIETIFSIVKLAKPPANFRKLTVKLENFPDLRITQHQVRPEVENQAVSFI